MTQNIELQCNIRMYREVHEFMDDTFPSKIYIIQQKGLERMPKVNFNLY